jgi:hydrogenase-4 component B
LFGFKPTLGFLSAIFLTVISFVSGLVGVYSIRYLEAYQATYNKYSVHFLMALFVFGMQAVVLANNTFSFMFFWEVMSLSSFFLVLADKSKESFSAAFLYFIMTHLGASAILGGFLILGNGSLLFDFSMISDASRALSPLLLSVSFGLLLFGFGSKAGLVPFHVWLPEAHPQAPSNISALMSGLMLKVAIYGFLLVILEFSSLPVWSGLVVIALGLVSGLIGALYAALESDIKRAFAYSSIENMGIVFTMVGLAMYLKNFYEATPLFGLFIPLVVFAIFHAISHAFFKTALFLSSGVIISRVHSRSLEVMGGFAKALPLFSFVFLLAIFGALPVPPFATFFGEWGFIHALVVLLSGAAVQKTLIAVLVVILSAIGLIGGLAAFAMVKIFAISMLGLPRDKKHEIKPEQGDNLMIMPIGILVSSVVALGIFAKPLIASLTSHLTNSSAGAATVGAQFSSLGLFLLVAGSLLFAYLFDLLFAREKGERPYHTWDCGQPINATMEYTSSAFVAPIRFFFASLIGRTRSVTSEPVVATNVWIRKYSFYLRIHPALKDTLYRPVINLFLAWAEKAKTIQSGRIQYYLLLLLVTLIIALSIAL